MSTTMAEPEWDEQTRDLVAAHATLALCPLCGRPAEVCQDSARQFDWEAPEPVRCHATTALMIAQRKVTEETNPQSGALLWSTRLREGAGRG